MKVKTQILNPELPTPPLQYAKPGDAGIDLTATSISQDEEGNLVYGTNRAFEIPDGFVGLLFPRSSNSKYDVRLSNCVGVLDSGYRGEVTFKFKPAPVYRFENPAPKHYKVGDRIGQMIILPFPKITFEEADTLSETERGSGGFGSSGNL